MTATNDVEVDVLICGAGASGLTLAIDLARRGVSFRLIEKMAEPFRGSRGKALQPRTLEVFEDLGIVDRVAAAGGPYPPQREYREDGSHAESQVMAKATATPAEPYPVTLMVPQFLTEALMRERLIELGHRSEFGCELIGFEQDADGVVARIAATDRDPKSDVEATCRARYLVGTDGGRSFVRRTLGLDFEGKALGVRAMVADVVLTGLQRDAWHRFQRGPQGKPMSICPLVGTPMFQLQAPVPPEGDIDLSPAGLEKMVAQRTGRDDIRIESVSWASVFAPHARIAGRYRVGRVFIAGDAAHTHPPTGGQGLNTSVQDAYNLGWKLAAALGGAPDALLDSYEEERRPIAAVMLGLATRLLDAIKQGELRRGREVQQLDLSYAQASLALAQSERGGRVLAGDRAPDAPLRGAGGQPMRLFELFKGAHWTLIGFHAGDAPVAPRPGLRIHRVGGGHGEHGDLVDADGHVAAAYGLVAGEWMLVRPDGHVGAIVAAAEVAALEPYLRRVGLGLA